MANQRRRSAIIELHLQGKRGSEIARELGIPRQRVSETISRYNELGTTEDRPRSGRRHTSNTPALRKIIKRKIKRNPRRSMRKIAIEAGISSERVRYIVKEELKLRSYKIQNAQHLDDKKKEIRLERCRRLRRRVQSGGHRKILFSDETMINIEAVFNKQNDRILAPDLQAATSSGRLTGRTKFPKQLMAWGGISYQGKTPLVFFIPPERVNTQTYRDKILIPLRDRWAPTLFGDEDWTFLQDSAGPHTSDKTQDWCRENFPDFITKEDWPSNSPDLNPLDYCFWSILKAKSCTTSHKNLEELKHSLRREWAKIDIGVIQKSIDEFPKRLWACVKAKGGHFENV
jgi:transposase